MNEINKILKLGEILEKCVINIAETFIDEIKNTSKLNVLNAIKNNKCVSSGSKIFWNNKEIIAILIVGDQKQIKKEIEKW